MPSEPIIIVVSALANLLLNIEPSQATTPWCLGHFVRQEWRENIRQVNLRVSSKVPVRAFEILRHHAEVNALGAQNVPHLAQHFLDAHVGTRVAGAVVAGKQQLQLFAGLPRLASPSIHPAFAFDDAADPGFQDKVHHAAEPPRSRQARADT